MDERAARRAGCYWYENKPFISVTNVLKVIDKPALRHWYGQQVYLAMAKDPGLGERDALAAPYKASGSAKDRGSAVHAMIENWKNLGEALHDPQYQGYAQAFNQFLSENHVTPIEHERTVVSRKHKYAGTLDMIANINGNERKMLIDFKTGKNLYPEVHLQLSAYKNAMEENDNEEYDTAAVLINQDGTYTYQKGKDQFKAFWHALELYKALNYERLEKLGY